MRLFSDLQEHHTDQHFIFLSKTDHDINTPLLDVVHELAVNDVTVYEPPISHVTMIATTD